jgi:hypothetical protein
MGHVMIQISGALLLLVLYFGAGLQILIFWPGLGGSLFARYCEAAGLLSVPCQTSATIIAAEAFAATLLVAAVTVGFVQKSRRDGSVPPAIEPFEASRDLMTLLLAATAAVLIAHNIYHAPTGSRGYRVEESAFVSIESLAWPLFLQLIFWTQQLRCRGLLASFLLAIVAISPFRNALFSIIYFAVLVPSAGILIVNKTSSRRTKAFGVAWIAVLVLLIATSVVYQTGRRIASNPAEPARVQVAKVEEALTFRAFAPFFGAVFVDYLAHAGRPLPNFFESITEKFRVTTNLNEYAYKKLFGGDIPYQETTLYYGEAVVNARISPIFWQFAAPLALVLAYFLLRPICDVSILIAIALWRGAMGGLFDIVTALVLQVGFCLLLALLQRRSRGYPASAQAI